MMTDTLRRILVVCIILYFVIMFRLLKKGRLSLKYSLLWLIMGVVVAILVIFPGLLELFSIWFGVFDPMNGLFTVAIGFIVILLVSLTAIVSKQSDRIKNLVQDNALLEKRIRDLEKKNEC